MIPRTGKETDLFKRPVGSGRILRGQVRYIHLYEIRKNIRENPTAGELPGAMKKVFYIDIPDLTAVFYAQISKNRFI